MTFIEVLKRLHEGKSIPPAAMSIVGACLGGIMNEGPEFTLGELRAWASFVWWCTQ